MRFDSGFRVQDDLRARGLGVSGTGVFFPSSYRKPGLRAILGALGIGLSVAGSEGSTFPNPVAPRSHKSRMTHMVTSVRHPPSPTPHKEKTSATRHPKAFPRSPLSRHHHAVFCIRLLSKSGGFAECRICLLLVIG